MQFHAWKHMIRMIPYDSMHGTMAYRPSMQFHAWNHMIPYMEPYDSMHGKVWKEKQKFEILKISNFRSTSVSLSGNNWKTTGFDST